MDERPPPPPPPRRPPSIHRDTSTQTIPYEEQKEIYEEESSALEISNEQEAMKLNIRSLNGEIIQILIATGMVPEDLSHSVAHAVLSPSEGSRLIESWSADTGIVDWSRIAGLFREKDGVFVPLAILLNDCQMHTNDIFRVSRTPARQLQQTKKSELNPGFKRELGLYAIIVLYLGWMLATGENIGHLFERSVEKVELLFLKLMNLPLQMMDTFIDYPLKELYRSGPSVIGWEGHSLPQICSQITHMGDEAFWSRNVDECQKIYDTKEMASLQFRKPFVFLLLAYLFFLAIRSLVHTWAVREQNRPHSEMIEIYQTFKMLMKVLQRGMNVKDDERRRGRHR